MTRTRLFIDSDFEVNQPLHLSAERSHYLCRVLRARAEDDVVVFNGDGNAWLANVVQPDARRARLLVRGMTVAAAPPACHLHLAMAMLKGDRQDYVLQKAAELGVTDVWLLQTERTEARVRNERLASRLEHWQRVLQSSCEQCGRWRVPLLHPPAPLDALWQALDETTAFFFQPGAPQFDPPHDIADVAVIIGPEGGFSDAECGAAVANGANLVGLGQLVLRADTAPVAVLSLIRQGWHWSAP